MRGYRQPLPVPARPDIGIATIPLLAVCRGVAGARVNDRDLSQYTDSDIVHRETAYRHRASGLCEEMVLVGERPVGVRAKEVLGQDVNRAAGKRRFASISEGNIRQKNFAPTVRRPLLGLH
jgi:hypothetical protein